MSEQISVIIPVYNVEKYLDCCIQSLLAQTWQEWQAILVDDGSTDGSAKICDHWAKKDCRIVVLHQKNQGVSAARNAGIAMAAGKYLAFVDADDRVKPEYLEVLRENLHDADVAVCGVDNGQVGQKSLPAEIQTIEILRHTPSHYAKLPYINYVYNKLYRAEIIRENGLKFPEQMRRGEDACFVLEYLCCCGKISVVPACLYDYDQHEGSAMHKFYAGVCEDELRLMRLQETFFHPDGPESLSRQEEEAFRFWQHGKILSILRYIVNYAPEHAVKIWLIKELFTPESVRGIFVSPPGQVGPKARLAAWLFCRGWYHPMCWLLKRI